MSDFEWPWAKRLAPVLQSEAAECGLASLTMIARHFGHRVDLAGMRQRFPTSIQGMTLAQIMAAASDLCLSPRAVRLELDELKDLALPAILHWDLNHFVVLENVRGERLTILDPAVGRIQMMLSKADEHFTGVALELTPTVDFKPLVARVQTRLSDLWSQLTNFRGSIIQLLLLSLIVQAASLISPLFMQLVVDEAVIQNDSSLLFVLILGFGFIYLLQAITRILRSWVTLCFGESLTFQLAGNIIRHLMKLPMGFFERRHVGDILSRLGSIQPIQSLLTRGLVDAIIDSTLVLATLVVMFVMSVPLAIITLVATTIYLILSQLSFPAQRARTEEEIVARANEETYLLESLRAMRAVKLHGSEAMRESGWRNRYGDVISASYRSRILGLKIDFAEDIVSNSAYLLTVYFGALAVISQTMTVGALLAFLSYRGTFSGSAMALVRQWQRWRLLSVHLERLSDIVGEKPEALSPTLQRGPKGQAPVIRAHDLTFAYSSTDAPVLNRVNFEIPAGQLVAIVGPSGAGKTTLMRLLLGLLTPQSGTLEIDGTPLNAANLGEWRARIGAVMQDDYLLTGTLADNISFFHPQPNQWLIEEAAKFACVHSDVQQMPMGYHSLVSDMGAALSSGQRQRLLLARAVYRQPDMLVLDEGTANLDEQTESVIARSIAAWSITRIAISHRPALVNLAAQVLHVEGGTVRVLRAPPQASTPVRRIA
jgi:ATP-binding cassette, subfamily B, bacterial CvaB/MchF/RaxB